MDLAGIRRMHDETPLYRQLGLTVESAGEGRARLRMTVADASRNRGNTLHGGVIATLVDAAGTAAITSADRDGRPGATTDLNVTCLAPAPLGATVLADGTVLRSGKTLAYVTVDVRLEDGTLVAQGRMTKFML